MSATVRHDRNAGDQTNHDHEAATVTFSDVTYKLSHVTKEEEAQKDTT